MRGARHNGAMPSSPRHGLVAALLAAAGCGAPAPSLDDPAPPDAALPAAPIVRAVTPSPGAAPVARFAVEAPAGTRVLVYATADCTGAPHADLPAEQLAMTGFELDVAPGQRAIAARPRQPAAVTVTVEAGAARAGPGHCRSAHARPAHWPAAEPHRRPPPHAPSRVAPALVGSTCARRRRRMSGRRPNHD